MARKLPPPSDVAFPVIAALVMFIVAIIVRNFWLSIILGVIGAATFAYAVFRLREYQKCLPNDDSGAP
jgi:Flp pilus assembly protein TadB